MGIFLLIVLLVVGFYLFRYYQAEKLEAAYESEKPIDVNNFSFEKAVEECRKIAKVISILDGEIARKDEEIKERQNINGGWMNILNILFKMGPYKEEKYNSEPEEEKHRMYRIWWRRGLICLIFSPFFALIASFASGWFILLLSGLMISYLFIVPFKMPSDVRKWMINTMMKYPWRSNTQPYGSEMYELQQVFNDLLEETHHLYYDCYLPCLRKAKELKNPNSVCYSDFNDIKKWDKEIKKRTPMARLKKYKKDIEGKSLKRILPDSIVSVVLEIHSVSKYLKNLGVLNLLAKNL